MPKQLDFVDDPDEKKPNTFSIRQKERAELCVQVIFKTNTDTRDQYSLDILDPLEIREQPLCRRLTFLNNATQDERECSDRKGYTV